MKRLLLTLILLASNASFAQGTCQHMAPAFQEAFNESLSDNSVDVRVSRVVNVEDRQEFGCHVIFDMTNGDQIGGIFLTNNVTSSKWTPDDDHQPHEYERRVMRKTLVLSLPLLQPPPTPAPNRKALPNHSIKFDANEVCGLIAKGRDSSTGYDAMTYQVARIRDDQQATLAALATTDQRLGMKGLTPQQIKQSTDIRKAQAEHVNYQIQLGAQIQIQCPAYFRRRQFDGR